MLRAKLGAAAVAWALPRSAGRADSAEASVHRRPLIRNEEPDSLAAANDFDEINSEFALSASGRALREQLEDPNIKPEDVDAWFATKMSQVPTRKELEDMEARGLAAWKEDLRASAHDGRQTPLAQIDAIARSIGGEEPRRQVTQAKQEGRPSAIVQTKEVGGRARAAKRSKARRQGHVEPDVEPDPEETDAEKDIFEDLDGFPVSSTPAPMSRATCHVEICSQDWRPKKDLDENYVCRGIPCTQQECCNMADDLTRTAAQPAADGQPAHTRRIKRTTQEKHKQDGGSKPKGSGKSEKGKEEIESQKGESKTSLFLKDLAIGASVVAVGGVVFAVFRLMKSGKGSQPGDELAAADGEYYGEGEVYAGEYGEAEVYAEGEYVEGAEYAEGAEYVEGAEGQG